MTAGRRVELTDGDGRRFGAWLAQPDTAVHGALVVVQEIFGVNAHIRNVVERFAEHGFVAIAPMLFDRLRDGAQLGSDEDLELRYDEAGVAKGRDLVARLGFDNALRDVAVAARHVGARRRAVGVVGYCWGGTVALLSNTRMKHPAVSYYGGRSVPFLHERPGAPLMMHFGEHDPIIPPADLAKTRAALPEAEIHVYPVGHGFNCDHRKDYDAASAGLALERTLAFFARHLA